MSREQLVTRVRIQVSSSAASSNTHPLHSGKLKPARQRRQRNAALLWGDLIMGTPPPDTMTREMNRAGWSQKLSQGGDHKVNRRRCCSQYSSFFYFSSPELAPFRCLRYWRKRSLWTLSACVQRSTNCLKYRIIIYSGKPDYWPKAAPSAENPIFGSGKEWIPWKSLIWSRRTSESRILLVASERNTRELKKREKRLMLKRETWKWSNYTRDGINRDLNVLLLLYGLMIAVLKAFRLYKRIHYRTCRRGSVLGWSLWGSLSREMTRIRWTVCLDGVSWSTSRMYCWDWKSLGFSLLI